jgi:Flp pilus assembly protein TadG
MNCTSRHNDRKNGDMANRRGTIVILVAFLLVMIFAFVAFSVDLGFVALTRSQLQNKADAAALAAALELSGSSDAATVRSNARKAASEIVIANNGGSASDTYFDASQDLVFGQQIWNAQSNSYVFQWGDEFFPYNVVKAYSRRSVRDPVTPGGPSRDERLPLFFAPVLAHGSTAISTSAIATYQPRDIMVVLDFSASMNDDSALGAIGKLGRAAVEENLFKMWQELGSPVYGKLGFTPQYAVLAGQPASGKIPHIDVTYQGTAVGVVSTMTLNNVVLVFTDGKTQTISNLTAKTGTFQGSGSNSGKQIATAYVQSGSNSSKDGKGYGEKFEFTAANLKTALGLANVAYPYPSGSWDGYISYSNSSSESAASAGYRWKYGYLTWLSYLQEKYPSASQTPDLWKTSEQPVACLKDGVDLFIDYVTALKSNDRAGLVIYTYPGSAGAILESALSTNLAQIKTMTRQRQAGHYDPYTHIGGGMQVARQHFQTSARPSVHKLMVLMTDGLPNRPSNTTTATNLVISEANAAKAAGIEILTISLGASADTSLMQQVADITKGVHFNVPGGASMADYASQLQVVFRKIADSRKPKLIAEPAQ